MPCPICHRRNARRACPARGDEICTVCCATKRRVEIPCPAECVYLASAQKHPAVPVRRQHDADVRALADTFGRLTERQYRLGFLILTFVGRYEPQGLARLVDADVAEAAASIAATFETASRGVIYEHTASSTVASGLASELRALLDEIARGAGASFEREAAEVLRAIERGAREGSAREGDRRYLELIDRVVPKGTSAEAAGAASTAESPKLILP
jgi:hypothetical protein